MKKRIVAILAAVLVILSAVISVSAANTYIRGDVDSNGDVTIIDATLIQRKLASLQVGSFNEKAADADNDGSVTILDATAIQRYLAFYANTHGINTTVVDTSPTEEYELPFIPG